MAMNASPAGPPKGFHDDIIYPHTIPFVLVHLACLGALCTRIGLLHSGVAIGQCASARACGLDLRQQRRMRLTGPALHVRRGVRLLTGR